MEYRLSGSGIHSDPRDRKPSPRRATAPPPPSAGPAQRAPAPPGAGSAGRSSSPPPRARRCPICSSSACGERLGALVPANTAASQSIGVFTLGRETGVTANATSSQSALAAMLTPPGEPTVYPANAEGFFAIGITLYGLVYFLVALSLGVTVGDGDQAIDPGLGLALGTALVWFFVWSVKALRRRWRAHYAAEAATFPERRARFERGVADWNQAVYCRRTGEVWIPSIRRSLPAARAIDALFRSPVPPDGQRGRTGRH